MQVMQVNKINGVGSSFCKKEVGGLPTSTLLTDLNRAKSQPLHSHWAQPTRLKPLTALV